ncbi:DNA-directed RNA polymerase subunit beta' [Orenia metallireducens]|uniref:DNA-directed RNA polymerase subunit beta' n=1 Tax=Orenia metallireducens TaxID=1413210 RepID=A0A1C0ABT5_9FIRM|nr:DNA-directed RNA polymerase subunit beta' [Orenia metallireducens]OCL27845.1 DNA-directed RNA polymerase subunit beta' [Orenia metallireducens]
MFNVNNFDSMKIGLASPEKIRSWSSGEVKKPETINYRTLKPEKEGLFCEKIFGPTKDWECHCGKYKRVRYKGVVCDRCGVEVTRSKVRRERMGHIELAAPVSHIWFFKGIPSRLGLVMDMSPRSLEKVLYFVSYIVIDPGESPLSKKQLLTENEYREARTKYGDNFQADMGAEAIKEVLRNIELDKEVEELRETIKSVSGQRRKRAVRRLKVLEGLRNSGNRPEWMILDVIPVIPPELRPMVQLDGGRFATSDLNDLYRRVINRNNRLKRLLDLGAPDIIIRNEKRMLQEAVDALIDNGRRGRPVTGAGNRPLKSLSDMLKGKQGRFRQNLLGKRVDYSGRSVIVVGPNLRLDQCGLPKKMALELFKPFVMKRLVDKELAHNIKSAKGMVEKLDERVWDVLEEVIKEHPVLLNRAPTLHRLGIQAFEPILVEGKAIRVHPLVCPAYNADFDGDQMAVHVPLSAEAQAECRLLMLSTYNILAPSDGGAIAVPSQDMVLGAYYLTILKDGAKGEGKIFGSTDGVIKAYENDQVTLQTKIKYRLPNGEWIDTGVGRVIFNDVLPEELPFYNEVFDKKRLGRLVSESHRKLGPNKTAEILDSVKNLTFSYATKSGITISVTDVDIPQAKYDIVKESEDKVDKIEKQYRRGLITERERYQRVIDVWSKAKDRVTEALIDNLDEFNPIYMMATSGARGNKSQITQLGGMRGLMADPSGRIIDMPIKASFREGLTVLEFFISTHGARKGLADTALRTADSGYLTRRLVDVSQDVIVREEDCGTEDGLLIKAIAEDGEIIEPLSERIIGRVPSGDLVNPETGEVIVHKNETITEEIMEEIEAAGIEEVEIRTVLTCRTEHGVCQRCYGRNLADGKMVNVGEAIGIMAAQSIGEPGTQLTMRTFHTGGVAGDDITQGLPRVEELFEARSPKGQAVVTELDGQVNIVENGRSYKAVIKTKDGRQKTYQLPYGSELRIKDGDYVEAGDRLTKGPLDPEDILRISGKRSVQKYLLREVQSVYRSQGVEINDKHIEVIVRQMMNKVKIKEAGDTELLPGSLVDIFEFEAVNDKVIAEGKEPATATPELLGITKASLATESFLSAASFQETTRVLTEASLEGKSDSLLGLKENVIIGQLIPAGTGMRRYREIPSEVVE